MNQTPVIPNLTRAERYPLPPHDTASLECLLHRLHPIYERLLKRRFSDTSASRAVDVALRVGRNALSSGKAARMSAEERAGWLWRVAFNAARKAAVREPKFVSLKNEPGESSEPDSDQALLARLRSAIANLPPKQMQAIELRGLQELSLRAAGRLIGACPTTVANRYHAGLGRLAAAMKAVVQNSLSK